MIHIIKNLNDPYFYLIKDDPVRPEIPPLERISKNKEVLILIENNTPQSVVCVCFQNTIPRNTDELVSSKYPTVAVFYTIWSYSPGAGKRLLLEAKEYIKNYKPNIKKFVTLSPKTSLARDFHTSNGAIELKINDETINYEYQ